MTCLLLRLAGPLQAWGDASRFTRRDTRLYPTKSGVLGLLAAAQGRRRTDPIEDLARLRFGVRVDQPGQLLRDFQTAIRLDTGAKMPLSYRYYIADAVFVAGVEGDQALLEGLDEAIAAPRFPVYLGRRSCPTTGRISLGLADGSLEDALRAVPWQAATWHRRTKGLKVELDLFSDAVSGESDPVETRRDVPLSFDPNLREYGWRDVAHREPVVVENPDGRTEPDWLAELRRA